MARYDDRINKLLGEYVIGEGNRFVRDKKNKPKKSKGAPEQHMDEDEPDDDDTAEEEKGLKENITGVGLGGMMNMSGNTNPAPGWNYVGGRQLGGQSNAVDQDDEDKTGEVSDRDLVKNVKKKHTAGQKLLTKAARELKKNKGSLSSRTRDALARDEYASWSGHGREEDAESWVDPAHEGDCTPMSKPSCTPRRKAFARRAKAGDFKKK